MIASNRIVGDEMAALTFSVAHCVIIAHLELLQMLDKTALQITGSRRFYGRVYQTFSAGHAMEIILLRSNTRQEAVHDKSVSPRVEIVRGEGWQSSPAVQTWHSTSFKCLLTKSARYLRLVDDGSLRACRCHQTKSLAKIIESEKTMMNRRNEIRNERIGILTLAGKGTAKPLGRHFFTISDASGFN